jgi:hypothetical protein
MRLITDILRDVRKGAAVEEATNALNDVVRAVDETGKKGSITIVLNVVPAPHGGPEKQIVVEVKSKKPIASIAPAVFFSDQDGDLHRSDPAQEEMPFAPAEVKKGESA